MLASTQTDYKGEKVKNILIVESSVRNGRIADKIMEIVQAAAAKFDNVHVQVADLKDVNLPFFDQPVSPSNWTETPDIPELKKWEKLVSESDGVLLVTPEYNSSTSAVLKNAIDWLYTPWKDKPVALVGYGWDGAVVGRKHLNDIMNRLKSKLVPVETGLAFTKDIDLEGKAISEDAKKAVEETITSLLQTIG